MANGIMDLPQGQPQQQMPPMVSSADSYDAATTALGMVNPAQLQQYKAAIQQAIAKLQLSPEQIAQLIQVFEYLVQNKEQYPQVLQQLVQQGILEAGDLPEQFDAQLMGVILAVLHEMQGSPQQPSQFAEGGLADAAKHLQAQGRNGDTILAHINPQEAMMLKAMGGSGTINPHTGLPEFGFNLGKFISNSVKSVVNVGKEILSSPIGQIVGTVALATVLGPVAAGMGLGAGAAAGLASAGVSLLSGGSLKDALVNGALGYFGGGGGIGGFNPSEAIQKMLPVGAADWLGKALAGGATGGISALAQGKGVAEALRQGAQSAATSAAGNLAANVLPASQTGGAGSQPAAPVETPAGMNVNAPGAVGPTGTAATPTPGLVAPPAAAPLYGTRQASDILDMGFGSGANAPSIEAAPTAGSRAVDLGFGNGTAAAPATGIMSTLGEYGSRALQYAKENPVTTAAGLTALAMAGGAGKPMAVKQDPLNFKPDTSGGQDYINAHPEIFGQWKGWGPGSAAPTGSGAVPTLGPQPRGLASLQAAPLYTPPTAAVTGGQPLNQPYNIAGAYRIPVYNDGGTVNNPMYSGSRPMGMTNSAFASGGHYPRRNGAIDGPGTGTSDSIPAMLSDGEFVFTAKAVRNAGGGSRRAGAKKMYQLMHKLERGGKVQGA